MNGQSPENIVIIGAGPAGCAAAIQLARAGGHVTIIEALDFPRHRPGETLHPGIEPLLKKLGVFDAVEAKGFRRFSGNRISWAPNEVEFFESFGRDEHGPWLGYQAIRSEFDSILLDVARKAGIRILQPARVTRFVGSGARVTGVVVNGKTIDAEWVLDASGRNSVLEKFLRLPVSKHSDPLFARFGYVAADGSFPSRGNPLIDRDGTGWTWIAPLSEKRIAWVRTSFSTSPVSAGWLPPLLIDHTVLNASKGADVTWRTADQAAGNGWMLLGDAAGSLDPAASHGVLRAMMSGMQAGHLINASRQQEITRSQASKVYSDWLKEWFHRDIERMRELYSTGPGAAVVRA